MTEMATAQDSQTQKIEFTLGGQMYCVDVRYVTEVANVSEITPIPGASEHVQGMMDLRGRTTSIIDPKIAFDIEDTGDAESILVFDPTEVDDGAVGWIVNEVTQVAEIDDTEIGDALAGSNDAVRGILHRDDEFVIWVDPNGISL